MLPREVTIKLVEEELVGLRAWANRKGVSVTWHPDLASLRAVLQRRDESFFLQADLDSYRALPPSWTFRDRTWAGGKSPRDWPGPGSVPGGGSSIFHNNVVICAPFNRCAYAEYGGPHTDWNGPANWLSAGTGSVQAHTLADMLAVIALHLRYSNGRMG